MSSPKVLALIPAHMASIRFPEKILFRFCGQPMIEHVRRRVMLCEALDDVIVATCDEAIAQAVQDGGGKVIMTGDHHLNGTMRSAEAAEHLDCTHVILVQGDEPLIKPAYLDAMVAAINANPDGDAWNATAPLNSPEEAERHSFVKCAIAPDERILYCFRKSPSYADFTGQQSYIRKILGIIAFRKEMLQQLVTLPPAPIERLEFIEQMRMIEHGFTIRSVPFDEALPSVNEPQDTELVLNCLKNDSEQKALLYKTFGVTI